MLGIPDGGLAGEYRLSWAVHGGASGEDWGIGAALDESGRTYLSGNYEGAARLFDAEGNPIIELPPTSSVEDGFLARYSPTGEPLWAVTLASDGDDKAWCLDAVTGGVLVGGWFDEPMVLGSSPKQVTLQSVGKRDGYLARFTDQGGLVWARSFGGPGDIDAYYHVAALPEERVAAVGTLCESGVVGLGEPNETHLETGGTEEGAVVAVYEEDGDLAWARALTRTESVVGARGIAALPDGSIAVAGVFTDQAIFGHGEENETLVDAAGERDCFVARLSESGSLVWAIGLGIDGRTDHPRIGARVASAPGGDIIASAGFCGAAPVGKEGEPAVMHQTPEGACTPYLARFTQEGERVWSVAPGGGGHLAHAFGVSVLPNGRIVIGGRFSETAVFGLDEPNETVIATPLWQSDEGFLAMYDPDGFLLWVLALPGPGRNWPLQIASDDDTIVVAGGFSWNTVFGTGPFDSVTLESAGEYDAFLMRMDLTGAEPD